MSTAARRSSLYIALVGVALLTAMPAPKAEASDAGRVIGAIAAGYLAYELLDNSGGYGGRYSAPPAHRNYNPPSCYSGGSPRYWYDTGYGDGYRDGTQYGYHVGYRDGDRHGYRRGTSDSYRGGYSGGRGDGRHGGGYSSYSRGRR